MATRERVGTRAGRSFVVGLLLAACGPIAGLHEKPCQPGCVDERTRLVCDDDGSGKAVPCPAATLPCGISQCSHGECVEGPNVGAKCGPNGLAHCNEGYACIGPKTTLSASYNHTCALADDGRVWCWGDNHYGAVGDGTTEWTRGNPSPVHGLPADRRAIAVSAGFTTSCALVEGGDAYCWGDNNYGKVDPDSSVPIVTVARPVRAPEGVHFSKIRAAGSHTCALAKDGSVFCWGATLSGQCGVDPNAAGADRVGPTRVPNLDHVTQIESVKNHTCAVRDRRPTLMCWGANDYAEAEGGGYIVQKLGPNTGGLRYSATPIAVDLAPYNDGAQADVIDVATGYDSTYVVLYDGGKLYAFGLNADDRLGTGSTELVGATPDTVKRRDLQELILPLIGHPVVARSGSTSECAKMVDDGRYVCWGTDRSGELGVEGSTGQTQKYATLATVLPDNADNMARGEAHACVTVTTQDAAHDDRTEIWCYGRLGYVGNGSTDTDRAQLKPAPVVWDPHILEDALRGD